MSDASAQACAGSISGSAGSSSVSATTGVNSFGRVCVADVAGSSSDMAASACIATSASGGAFHGGVSSVAGSSGSSAARFSAAAGTSHGGVSSVAGLSGSATARFSDGRATADSAGLSGRIRGFFAAASSCGLCSCVPSIMPSLLCALAAIGAKASMRNSVITKPAYSSGARLKSCLP